MRGTKIAAIFCRDCHRQVDTLDGHKCMDDVLIVFKIRQIMMRREACRSTNSQMMVSETDYLEQIAETLEQ